MTEQSKGRPFWRRLPEGPTIAAGAVTLVIVSMVAIPAPSNDSVGDPVAEAAEAYRSLLDQMEVGARTPATQPTFATEDSSDGRAPLDRDLFRPKPKPRPQPQVPKKPAAPKPPPLPTLSAILIGGGGRQAILGGEVVTVDEEVGGYRVVAIERDAVILARQGHIHRLKIGGS